MDHLRSDPPQDLRISNRVDPVSAELPLTSDPTDQQQGSYPTSWSDLPSISDLLHNGGDTQRKRRRIDQANTPVPGLSNAPPNGSAKTKKFARKRSLNACEICRARKTKCDNQRPSCGACIRIGSACDYGDRNNDFSSFDAGTLAILDRLNYVTGLLEEGRGRAEVSAPPVRTVPTPRVNTPQCDDQCHVKDANDPDYQTVNRESLELLVNHHSCSSEILEWPIFDNAYTQRDIDVALFNPAAPSKFGSSAVVDMGGKDIFDFQISVRGSGQCVGVHEETCPSLIQAFLANVHPKNPILDTREIIRLSRDTAENGFGWNAKSCLLLIASALGAISKPFSPPGSTADLAPIDTQGKTSIANTPDYPIAEQYYVAALKRVGLLRHDIVAVQCWFLCGVYEMYSCRPIQALTSFCRACNTFQYYVLGNPCPSDACDTAPSTLRSLEHRLYWSCLKSECEIRTFITATPSGISHLEYPCFPSLPSDPTSDETLEIPESPFEQSWLYYLSEISGRRILNRIINSFYHISNSDWLTENRGRMIRIASELESQVKQWEYHIPDTVRWQDNANAHSELAVHLKGRAHDLYEHIYRPFLYIAVHEPVDTPQDPRIIDFVRKYMETSNQLGEYAQMTLGHRHHGSWFTCRAYFATALKLLAAVKCGRVDVPNGWPDEVRRVLSALTYWEGEAPDLTRAKHVLVDILGTLGRADIAKDLGVA